jgi:hypothetical protein
MQEGMGDRGGTVVKLLCYRSEDRWFEPKVISPEEENSHAPRVINTLNTQV